jgi:hypothetical protein
MGGPLVSGAMLSSKLSFIAPVRGQHERRPSVLAAERAGEARRVEPDAFEHLAAFADPTRLSPRERTPVQMAPSRRCRFIGAGVVRRTRQFERLRSAAMSNAVGRPARDSAIVSVELSGVTAMALGNVITSAISAHGSVVGDERD